MQYGHFDPDSREYVITRPDTPRPWTNYLGGRTFGGVITNHLGGYAFYRSSAEGRLTRILFNNVPADQPGRYVYLRDRDSADYWTTAWQPVGKPLDQYQSRVHFGTGYATFHSEYAGIQTRTDCFVPLDREFEVHRLEITNAGSKTRTLDCFTYLELPSNWNIFQDAFNLQFAAYCVQTRYLGNGLVGSSILANLPENPANFVDNDQARHSWYALLGSEVEGHCLDREKFLGGAYRGYHNPLTVERGTCDNAEAYGDNACACLQTGLTLEPGQSKTLTILFGVGDAEKTAPPILEQFADDAFTRSQFDDLRASWHRQLGNLTCVTPDSDFDHMINVWNAYNALITFHWSRSASLVYTGDQRDGLGFRDSVQDILGILPAIPQDAHQRLELMLTGQESTGGARPEIRPYAHHPGQMEPTPADKYRSDDCLWFFNAIPAYVAETGDLDFYRKVLPYADQGEASVLGHLRRALEFNLERSGAHGLPCGLLADWNDCLKMGFKGETLFVAFQLRFGLKTYAEIAQTLGEDAEAAWAAERLQKLDTALSEHAWDGQWFVRAFREDGSIIGTKDDPEGSIFLNAQSWALLSGFATGDQAETAMNAVHQRLFTEFGLMLCAPPFVKTSHREVRAVLFNPGCKENAGIFNHTQGWAVIAETLLGHGDRAYQYYRAFMPAAYNDRAGLREVEPYVHAQSTHSKYSKKFGTARVPWLSGTATWSYFAATQYILGLRPDLDAFIVDPCIPATWPGFKATRNWRGHALEIEVKNPNGIQKGITSLTLNGQQLPPASTTAAGAPARIPLAALSRNSPNQIVATLG
ncbi:MAG: GH36-type glycosyl hydrolase domain-containing protein [Opitutales bacterium]